MIDTESHEKSIDEVIRGLQTDLDQGLGGSEARDRLRKYGPNELREKPRPGFFALLLNQFNNFLVIILIFTAAVMILLGEAIDAIAITVIIILNALLGVIQESKAEQAIAALKKMATPHARVIRDGRQTSIPSRELVVGDIVLLEAGNYVPADMRLVESINLKIEEASLTGESQLVEKNARVLLGKEIPLGDRKNNAFMGTLIIQGRGRGLVTGTGMDTQIGLIAGMLQSYEKEDTPLQQKLAQLGRVLGTACLAICGFVFLYGLIRDTHLATAFHDGFINYFLSEQQNIIALFMTAVSLAIAAIPEGLPAIVTICLAIGMQQMIKRHALIRKLPAVETLGCATVICSDKTGTLTQNQMTITQLWANNTRMSVTGEGYLPTGQFLVNDIPVNPHTDATVSLLLNGGLLCNDAKLEEVAGQSEQKTWRMVGDPTEGAMIAAAAKAGLWKHDAEEALPRVKEIPFDADRKRMTTIHEVKQMSKLPEASFQCPPIVAFVKGAPDIILDLCVSVMEDGQAVPLTEEKRKTILAVNTDMASQALRVLGVAHKSQEAVPEACNYEEIERDLTFVGLFGMIDPARPEVKEAVQVAQGAGLKNVMVTGDYKDTAVAIAREIGLLTPGGMVFTGAELDKMSDDELAKVINMTDTFCRVSPQHKTRIVDAFKSKDHVVAMTGDGVNDAPALKRADIGIAMGITGTDVSKETADIVLTDDNFASIIAAIEEGRIIYANIRKFVFYLVSCNIGEILIIFLSMLCGWPMPLKPIQLLMLNLITDGAPALALGMEKGDADIMQRPPRPTKEPVINWEMRIGTAAQAVSMTVAVLVAYHLAMEWYPYDPLHAKSIAFCTLCMSELFRAFTARSERLSLFAIGFFTNTWMLWAVGGSAALVLATIYLPFLQPIFHTTALHLTDWLMMTPFILLASVAAEITKVYIRKKASKMAARI